MRSIATSSSLTHVKFVATYSIKGTGPRGEWKYRVLCGLNNPYPLQLTINTQHPYLNGDGWSANTDCLLALIDSEAR